MHVNHLALQESPFSWPQAGSFDVSSRLWHICLIQSRRCTIIQTQLTFETIAESYCLLLFFSKWTVLEEGIKKLQSLFHMKVRDSVHYIRKNLLYCTIVTDVWGSREADPYFHLLPLRQCSISACHVSKTYQTTKLDLTRYIMSACLPRLGTYAFSIRKSLLNVL